MTPVPLQMEAAGSGEQVGGQRRLLHSRDHDEQADEQHQQDQSISAIDALRLHAPRDQQQRARHHRHFRHRPAAKKNTIMPADTASDFHSSAR